MGLFDKLKDTDKAELTPKSALALSAMTVIGADGVVDDEELDNLNRIVRGDNDAFQRALKLYKAKNPLECVPLVAQALDSKQRVATIAILLDIAMADGILASAEESLLNEYIGHFDIPEEILNTIIDVISIKNNFSIF